MSVSPNARKAFGLLRERGFSPEVAAGLVGNLMQESGPELKLDAVGDNGNSFGAAQWNGPRRRAFFLWAQQNGRAPTDLATQIDYLVHEMDTTERSAGERIRATRSPKEAAITASRAFWRPGRPHEDVRGWYAQNVFNALAAPGGAALAADGGTMTDAVNDPLREAARAELARRRGEGGAAAEPANPMRDAARAELARRKAEGEIAPPAQGKPSQARSTGVMDSFTQGITLGFGDEITAFESALLGRKPGGGTFDLGN